MSRIDLEEIRVQVSSIENRLLKWSKGIHDWISEASSRFETLENRILMLEKLHGNMPAPPVIPTKEAVKEPPKTRGLLEIE